MVVTSPMRSLLLAVVLVLLGAAAVTRTATAQSEGSTPADTVDATSGDGSGEDEGSAELGAAEGSGPGADPEAELAAVREAARLAAENTRLVMRTASAAVTLAVDSGRTRVAIQEARGRVSRAVEPARFAVETEEARIVLLRDALDAASDTMRTSVEVARVQSWTRRTVELDALTTARREERARRNEERRVTASSVLERLADPEEVASAATLYAAVVSDLESARSELAAALDEVYQPSAVPPRLRRPVPDDIAALHPAMMGEYEEALAKWDRLVASESEQRAQRIDAGAQVVFALNDTRLALLPHLARDTRERVLGLGQEGLAQGRREIRHLQLLARWYRYDRWKNLGSVSERAIECLTVASLRFSLMRLVLVLTLAILLLRRPDAWLSRLESWITARTGTAGVEPHWWKPTRGTLPDAIVLLAALLALRELRLLAPVAEVELLGRVLAAVATYRLVLSGTHQTLLWAAASAYVPVSTSISDRLRRSLRLAGRVAIGISVYLIVAEQLLGRGYLYRVVRQSAWVLAFPVAWWILRHWSKDVIDLYRRRLPNGTLAPLVERFGDGPLRSLLVIPAAIPLAYRAAIVGARATAYRFERSRKALSYLFLRQLERRQASRRASPEACALESELSASIVAPLRPEEVADVWPKASTRLLEHMQRWRDGAEFGSAAVVGERGVGKSAFVTFLLQSIHEETVCSVSLSLRSVETDVLLSEIAEQIGAPEGLGPQALASFLVDGPRRVIVVDDVHRCVRRIPGNQAAYHELLELIAHTGHHVYWLCTYGAFAWRWFQYSMSGRALHASVVRLDPWPDAAIERLIRGRMDALALEERYDDLVEDLTSDEARAIQLLETRDDFFRLVRDHADGIPRAALEVWASALVRHPDGSVRVQPLDTWEADDLEFLDEDGRFVLGAIVAQVDIEQDRIAQVLLLPQERVDAVLARLRVMGIVTGNGRDVRIADAWQRAAVAFARRKQLIAPG